MKNLPFSLAFLCLLITVSLFGQEEEESNIDNFINGFIMPSPESQELIKNINSSVELASGKATVSLPLYTLNAAHLQIPISIDYSSGGVKVDDISTDVGLGWSLNAGGKITRVIHGHPDETPRGYLNQMDNIPFPFDDTNPEAFVETFSGIKHFSDYADGQPDIFSYSIPGYSGRFILQPDGEVLQLNKTALKINWENLSIGGLEGDDDDKFTIVDPQGNTYQFGLGATDKSDVVSYALGNHNDCMQRSLAGYNMFNIPTTWHLKEISSTQTSEVIAFYYEDAYLTYESNYNETYSMPEKEYRQRACDSQCQPNPNIRIATCLTKSQHYINRLNRITSNYYKIDFNYSSIRNDIDPSSTGNHKLENIKVYTNEDVLLRKFEFVQDYWIATTSTTDIGNNTVNKYRMYLKQVIEKGNDGESLPPYEFEYIDGDLLPVRLSFDQDHWGYYNGAGNTNVFTPSRYYSFLSDLPENFDLSQEFEGANREVNENVSQYGVLSTVRTPYGGFYRYYYENHKISFFDDICTYLPHTNFATAIYLGYEGEEFPIHGSTQFEFTHDQIVSFDIDLIQQNGAEQANNGNVGHIKLISEVTGEEVKVWGQEAIGSGTNFPLTIDMTEEIWLPAGGYFLTANIYEEGEIATIQAYYETESCEYIENIKIGGLRVVKKRENDLITEYSYKKNNAKSSGILMVEPRYITTRLRQCPCLPVDGIMGGTGGSCALIPQGLMSRDVLRSSSIRNLYNVLGDYVNYSVVEEKIKDGNIPQGKIKSYFTITPDEDGDIEERFVKPNISYLASPKNNNGWRNKLLKKKQYYSASGFLFRQEEHEYQIIKGEIPALNAQRMYSDCIYPDTDIEQFDIEYYRIYSGFVHPKITTTDLFFEDGSTFSIITRPEYEYEDYNMISSMTSTLGFSQTTNYKYARQVEGDDSELVLKNMVGIPLEVETSGVTTKGQKTTYQSIGDFIVPHQFLSKNRDTGAWEFEASIEAYNTDGLPRKVLRRGFNNTSDDMEHFLWENGLLKERTFKTRTASYIHYPERTIESITGIDGQITNYTYDGFQRMHQAFQRDNNVTLTNDYYIGQSVGIFNWNYVFTHKEFNGVNTPYDFSEAVFYDEVGKVMSTLKQGHLQSFNVYDALGRLTASKAENASYFQEYNYYRVPVEKLKESWAAGWGAIMQHSEYADYDYEDPTFSTLYLITETIDENGRVFKEYKDYFGRLHKTVREHNGEDVVTKYIYDNGGNVKEIIPPEGVSYTFNYDGRNRLENKTIPHEGTYNYLYNMRDELHIETKPTGTEYEYTYNDFGEMTMTQENQAIAVSIFIGDSGIENGKVVHKQVKLYDEDIGLINYHYDYDSYGRLETTTIQHPWGKETITDVIDIADIVIANERVHTPNSNINGSPLTIEETYVPDIYGRNKTVYQQVTGHLEPQVISNTTYNNIDQPTAISVGGTDINNPLNTNTYGYNIRDWLKFINKINCQTDGTGGSENSISQLEELEEIDMADIVEIERRFSMQVNGWQIINNQPTTVAFKCETNWLGDSTTLFTYQDSTMMYVNGATEVQNNLPHTIHRTLTGDIEPEEVAELFIDAMENSSLSVGTMPTNYDVLKQQIKQCVGMMLENDDYEPSNQRKRSALFSEEIYYRKASPYGNIGAEPQYTGNISQVDWCIFGRNYLNTYSYEYDDLDRLKRAEFIPSEWVSNGDAYVSYDNPYGVEIAYNDLLGNMSSIRRNGFVGYTSNGSKDYGIMDNLDFTIEDGKMTNVTENANTEYGYKGNGSSFSYDNYGRLTAAPDRGIISIAYDARGNVSNIETQDGGSITFVYDAEGNKWKQTTTFPPSASPLESGNVEEKIYILGLEIVNGSREALYNEQGRLLFNPMGMADRYEFTIKDHLGNTRIYFSDKDGDGSIDLSSNTTEITQSISYYPFGLSIDGFTNELNPNFPRQAYKYNGKEELLEGIYDYGARMYDPATTRWASVDPLAEYAPNWTPYRYGFNNPILYTDPTGMFETKAAAQQYAKDEGIKTGFFRKNKINKQSDGSYAIENKQSNSFIANDSEFGIIKGALATERGVHLRDVGLDYLHEIGNMYSENYKPNAVIHIDWLDRAYYFGTLFSLVSPSSKAGQITKFVKAPFIQKPRVIFGNNPNQVHHAFRHVVKELKLDKELVKQAITKSFNKNYTKVVSGKAFNHIITVNGHRIQYSAYKLSDGTFNIGRIHGVK